MLVIVMAEVLRGSPGLVLAIAGHRRPGELERQKNEKKDRQPATHGPDCISENHLPEVHRKIRTPLPTTSRLAPMSAKTAIHMVALPKMASPRKIALIPKASPMFCQSTAWVR
jgi:hypothetical protein